MSEKCNIDLGEELRRAQKLLEGAGVPDAKNDAWLIMQECLHVGRAEYYMRAGRLCEVDRECLEDFNELLKKRSERIPLQYLFGVQEFMGLEFFVDSSVLIPRQDTEALVEAVLDYSKKRSGLSAADVCTGSGCIAVSLAHYGSFKSIDAFEISPEAIRIAKKNCDHNKVNVKIYESDLMSSAESDYDIIVSNPPYIESSVIESLEPEVKDFEPRLALDGGSDGLAFYRRILEQSKERLKAQGAIFFEIGCDEGAALLALFKEYGLSKGRILKDLSGRDRVAFAYKR